MPQLDDFITRWQRSQAAERANGQLFLSELCDVLDIPRPAPVVNDPEADGYIFEKPVVFRHGDGTTSSGYIDLYKRGCFVLETKQGAMAKESAAEALIGSSSAAKPRKGHGQRGSAVWDNSMRRARGQAESYARALDPEAEGRPPFVVVVDVGHRFELFAEFSRTGATYTPFPDARSNGFGLDDLRRQEVRDLLRRLWTDPLSLDPARIAAKVTREVADRLAVLAKSLESSGFDPGDVAHFLMRCLFTMFAEDVGLLPKACFRNLLTDLVKKPEWFPDKVREVWEKMNTGGRSLVLETHIAHFNGGLFAEATALPLSSEQIGLLLEAAKADWREVEPAIFGTLLERALDPRERHRLGAHYTPRGYVERLVLPTVIDPLRERWQGVEAAAQLLASEGKREEAFGLVHRFHLELCKVRVLDPACGTGNFLYVALEHMKRLEGEILRTATALRGGEVLVAEMMAGTVNPRQFLGLDINARATAIADLVLWIGYLQWHFRTYGDVRPPEPILSDFHGIEQRDALLVYDGIEPVKDAAGCPVTRWDGQTMKVHPATGLEVPDETARIPEVRYLKPRPATWPQVDFIVGNPPFIGAGLKRSVLGSGYMEALGVAYPEVAGSADFVMYWWHKAALAVCQGRTERFGFIATNSLGQTFNRRVLERHMSAEPPLSLIFAIPDHPWVDAADGAAVRIAMAVGRRGEHEGVLAKVVKERSTGSLENTVDLSVAFGRMNSDLSMGADISSATSLKANSGNISCRGVSLHGAGFIVTPEQAQGLGLGYRPGAEKHIRPYLNGKDVMATPRGVMVIDLFGLSSEEVYNYYPELYQWILERVKPAREAKSLGGTTDSKEYAMRWWLLGKSRGNFRPALAGLPRFISTVETAKHRVFVFLDASILPDNKLINIAIEDAYTLGVLSSRVHVCWALAQGSRLGVGNDPVYVKTRCFETFPFPTATPEQQARIRELGEGLDAHRKARQTLHPELTLTGMYNVLEKLRAGQVLTAKERTIHEQGLVSVLKELHDGLDAAVAEAYGWPADLPDQDILARLVALNRQRAEEEKRGLIRWLRPEYQNPAGTAVEAPTLELETTTAVAPTTRIPWPKELPAQVQAVAQTLAAATAPLSSAQVARTFQRAQAKQVEAILDALTGLGQARRVEGEKFTRAA